MSFYELAITTFLKEDISHKESLERISQNLSAAMLKDPDLKKLHGSKGFKYYVHNNFYPIKKSQDYKRGSVYIFNLRSPNLAFSKKMKRVLTNFDSSFMKVLSISIDKRRLGHIKEIRTITPAIITVDGKYWTKESDNGVRFVIERMHVNALKKYQTLFGEEIHSTNTFIKGIELLNRTPLLISYKDTTLVGNKFLLQVREDEDSQRLANMVMACGLLEKNSSVGAGFCHVSGGGM